MRRPAWCVVVVLLALAGMFWASSAGAQRPTRSGAGNGGGAKAEMWAVFKIGDDVSVEKQSELKSLKKKSDDDYKQEMAQYKDAVKAAGKSKDKSNLPKKPVKHIVKMLKGSFKTQQDAETWKDKYLSDKKSGSKSDKKSW